MTIQVPQTTGTPKCSSPFNDTYHVIEGNELPPSSYLSRGPLGPPLSPPPFPFSLDSRSVTCHLGAGLCRGGSLKPFSTWCFSFSELLNLKNVFLRRFPGSQHNLDDVCVRVFTLSYDMGLSIFTKLGFGVHTPPLTPCLPRRSSVNLSLSRTGHV